MPIKWRGEPGSPERMAHIAEVRAKKEAKKSSSGATNIDSGSLGSEAETDVFDLGEPASARMEGDTRPEKPRKGAKRKQGTLAQQAVHDKIKWPLDALSKWEGHEHWSRRDDEIACIAEPATRILNRHPEWVELVEKVGDPGALIFACVMILGPSVMEELNRVRSKAAGVQQPQQPRQRAAQQPRRQPQEPADEGLGGDGIANPSPISPLATNVAPPPPDLPSHFQ